MNEQACKAAEIVVVTVPFAALVETLKTVRPSLTPGKILVNVTVPLETAVGGKPTRTLGLWVGSAAEVASSAVPKGVILVTAFNNVSAEPLSDLSQKIDCDVLVCGAALRVAGHDALDGLGHVASSLDLVLHPACRAEVSNAWHDRCTDSEILRLHRRQARPPEDTGALSGLAGRHARSGQLHPPTREPPRLGRLTDSQPTEIHRRG